MQQKQADAEFTAGLSQALYGPTMRAVAHIQPDTISRLDVIGWLDDLCEKTGRPLGMLGDHASITTNLKWYAKPLPADMTDATLTRFISLLDLVMLAAAYENSPQWLRAAPSPTTTTTIKPRERSS